MSIYESRAEEIKREFAKWGFKISWRGRGSKVYAHVKVIDKNVVGWNLLNIEPLLRRYYNDPFVTSWGGDYGTFFCYDLVEMLKR